MAEPANSGGMLSVRKTLESRPPRPPRGQPPGQFPGAGRPFGRPLRRSPSIFLRRSPSRCLIFPKSGGGSVMCSAVRVSPLRDPPTSTVSPVLTAEIDVGPVCFSPNTVIAPTLVEPLTAQVHVVPSVLRTVSDVLDTAVTAPFCQSCTAVPPSRVMVASPCWRPPSPGSTRRLGAAGAEGDADG